LPVRFPEPKRANIAALCSAVAEFFGKTGAGEGIRTLDPNLGKKTD